jgi:hypothetical protein
VGVPAALAGLRLVGLGPGWALPTAAALALAAAAFTWQLLTQETRQARTLRDQAQVRVDSHRLAAQEVAQEVQRRALLLPAGPLKEAFKKYLFPPGACSA